MAEIQVERADGVLTITIARPAKKNALTAAMYQTMADALAEAEEDNAVRVILLRGGDGNFTAGNDLEDFLKSPPKDDTAPVFQFLARISSASKPIVVAVPGLAIGVGVTMLLHCDLVYAADTATFSLPFAQLGLCPEAASSVLLPRLAGHQVAAEKLLLGEAFDALEAHRIGIVNRVLPAAELDAFAAKQAAKLAALPASSLRVTKALLKDTGGVATSARMAEEARHFSAMLRAPEAREAMTAFFEKRKPDFRQFD
ncbi:enoyl-CoA hydratase [Burkholderia stabilis]|uniref:1,4-Dihydroxy-2-naphthoyl-CoA synthase,enoyl-CoA hydratase,phenylacetate degradation probable enoyl-CoA hydratase PaaB,Enoyl-CoA hydratase/isomerase family n=1 Tax=Burkholderia stabilis TaxID=95485 RepID=A0AAJ5T4Z9_9BURK|nr:enoyl-CoA hydratase [Burkholderia stabilis]AOR68757.1 enoyl-CoA hydratase [Burkholderia stabilis]VBB12765.1 1,4-Dihydroxy-2-naphthoyl-CoA synthase,enoyl-CoA hydratase,phenylacetate degradation probable enoyl-CoA hydratase PaaB,Enoyl-CoA hydratase/isomerase family [Burkholderia stabilis]HDR9492416.1 enoyl-CoA hydratase [Burkholderia stabilis]HDR9524421.1 enoyl-CoA hydratase [Burkholderia stabilis]HDR9532093.1 enoyl-CoA hydratase [Burkholderia stabilis]